MHVHLELQTNLFDMLNKAPYYNYTHLCLLDFSLTIYSEARTRVYIPNNVNMKLDPLVRC